VFPFDVCPVNCGKRIGYPSPPSSGARRGLPSPLIAPRGHYSGLWPKKDGTQSGILSCRYYPSFDTLLFIWPCHQVEPLARGTRMPAVLTFVCSSRYIQLRRRSSLASNAIVCSTPRSSVFTQHCSYDLLPTYEFSRYLDPLKTLQLFADSGVLSVVSYLAILRADFLLCIYAKYTSGTLLALPSIQPDQWVSQW